MRTKIILSFIVFNLLIVTGRGTTIDVHPKHIDLVKTTTIECTIASNTIYLTPATRNMIRGIDIRNAFMNGWKFEKHLDIYGYTATDDLWTFLGYGNTSNTNYNAIRIEIVGLENDPQAFNYCMNYINQVQIIFRSK